MSSFSVIQNHDSFVFAVDTAVSCMINGVIYRKKDTRTEKAFYIGKDMVFISGTEPYTEMTRAKIHTLIDNDGHIKVNEVQEYFKEEIKDGNLPQINKENSIIGVCILKIIDGQTSIVNMKQLHNNYQIVELDTPENGNSRLSVDGFKNTELAEKMMELYSQGRYDCSGFDNILEVYRTNYSEGIGSEIFVGTLDQTGANLIHTEKLKETGLRYVDKDFNILPDGCYINVHINGSSPITEANISSKSVAYATNAAYLNNAITASNAYMTPMEDGTIGCGSSYRRWSAVFSTTGSIVTSDRNKKNTIQELDERYLKLAKMLVPKSFKMNDGTSGRTHLGFIAQEVEDTMTACEISDTEFAGLIKAPVYANKLLDKDGNELPEYDTTSEITGYDYALRYDEFIPLLLARIGELEQKINSLQPNS